ncbi:guanylate-binding protein 5-like isoform X2 [Apodemus sylvaticus]|uniref:guanylate-binding protein 5-like isoform X2 n=1 Tax=Apodemus sylvaticus TaxID=10129 RepID=UPI002243887D|nr:guanylate-binding protein 5-like isoform X2 [Apodemus sylvaticus]XP_052035083.1 guanylate-binding protein 5-like isoform X2 [Apodemus sylvaticus]XP_052035084.1 guanylate-binding protein 5-like isoform X2 [Apodemus sylvaticus]
MAPEIHMSEPMCLIGNTEEHLVINQEALRILSAITQPVVVVAIVGLYRTGKSYLMNKLAGKERGFSIGSTVQSHTKGIWMWCVPHPQKPDHTLVLLDTEGLGDMEKVDKKNDTQIFALAILLSSTFVYNTMNKIDQEAIDLLHNVTELTDLLLTRNSPDPNQSEETADISFYPDLVWTLRDFFLGLKINGQAITSDEYLENSLKLKEGTDERTQTFNLPRLCIQKFFPVKKCFVFDSPARGSKLSQLQTLSDDELNPDFVQDLSEFCSHIFTHSKTKTLPGGIQVNGPRLESLVLTYVDAINSGALPSMENTVVTLVRRENSAAVQKAIVHYDQLMSQRVQLPTETLQELLDLHRTCEQEALGIFRKHSFKDDDQCFQKELESLLSAKQDELCKKNVDASADLCSTLLQSIFKPLEQEVAQGVYAKPEGHSLFLQRMEQLKAQYRQRPGKGTQAEEVLQEYLNAKEPVSNTILQTDQALTAKERQRKEEQARAEAALAETRRLEALHIQEEQRRAEQQRRHQEQLRQIEAERAKLQEEQRRIQEQKAQEEAARIEAEKEAEHRARQQKRDAMRELSHHHHRHNDCIVL